MEIILCYKCFGQFCNSSVVYFRLGGSLGISSVDDRTGSGDDDSVPDSGVSKARTTRSRNSGAEGTSLESRLGRQATDAVNNCSFPNSDDRNPQVSDSSNSHHSSPEAEPSPASKQALETTASRLRRECRRSGSLSAVKVEVKQEKTEASEEEDGEQDRRATTKALRMVRKEHRTSDVREDAG